MKLKSFLGVATLVEWVALAVVIELAARQLQLTAFLCGIVLLFVAWLHGSFEQFMSSETKARKSNSAI